MNHESPKDEMLQLSSEDPLPNDIDKISNLPDPILHHIMDLLPPRYAMRTSVLSKRFEKAWLKYSILDLNENQYLNYANDNNNDNNKEVKTPREMFLHHLKRCYERHDLPLLEKLKIHVKQITNNNVGDDVFLVIDLLLIQVAKGTSIKEMDLKFRTLDVPQIFENPKSNMFYESFYMIPRYHLFSWHKSLKSLKLKGCNFVAFESVSSGDIIFPFLKEFFVSHCLITDVLVSHLVNWCPELEDLTMQYLLHVKKIQFSHRKLNRLTIGCYRSSTMFEIDTPSLQVFEFKGTPWLYFSVGGIESQEVSFHPHHVINAPNLRTIFIKYARVYSATIRQTMTSLQNIKKVVFQWCFFPKAPRFSGENLERLMISDCEFAIGEGRLGFCEARFPNLKFLILYSCRNLEELIIHCPALVRLVLEKCDELKRYLLIARTRDEFNFIPA